MTPNGIITFKFGGDGVAGIGASLNQLFQTAVDEAGDLFIGDIGPENVSGSLGSQPEGEKRRFDFDEQGIRFRASP